MPTIKWMTSIPVAESADLHALAQSVNFQLSLKDEIVWLRGEAESEEALLEIDQRLRSIPGAQRYRVVDANLLQPIESVLPIRVHLDGPWYSAASMLSVELPSAGLAGQKPNEVELQIVRTATVEANSTLTPSILECEFAAWSQWALQSSEARLSALAFACNEVGRTMICGLPLPPLAGKRWIEYDNVAVEVGHSWKPSVSVKTLNRILAASSEAIHFLEVNGRHRVLDRASFVMATRSSIRTTAGSIGGVM